ncbi:MAG: Enoyl-CoA hydratase [uncultured Corynebacteriales bacterium]|uniref:Enoyl-CoA hydratase n=1 Tax=uncultured Mycobacteriales bacterium TaxID=581187 RepID=A0A6J4JY37_9ACTN|nr:MAG: Enoyl-CoA hydratase [uncultured Corynebacteriales bacterium]
MTDLAPPALIRLDEQGGGVALLTLSDPDRRNAMTAEMGAVLSGTLAELGARPDVRVVVLTGAGPAFSGGGDLGMLADKVARAKAGQDQTASMRRFYEAFLTVAEAPFPVLAAVNGHAVGAGACVAMACDLAIVSATAKIGFNFTKLGIHPGMGGSWTLPRLVGPQRAAELLYTGRLVTGEQAAAYGMALEAVPAAEVLPRTLALAAEIAAGAPQPLRQLKRSLAGSATRTLVEQLEVEASAQAENYRSEDVEEGLRAARERRAPVFRGR